MKEKVIETAGKTWKILAEKGEQNIAQLPKILKEEEVVVYQGLGWLAREDKINYTVKNKQVVVSLVESELRAFTDFFKKNNGAVSKNTIQTAQKQSTSAVRSTAPTAIIAKKRMGF